MLNSVYRCIFPVLFQPETTGLLGFTFDPVSVRDPERLCLHIVSTDCLKLAKDVISSPDTLTSSLN